MVDGALTFEQDKHLKINNSKLASFIVTDFHQRYFEKAKTKLVLAHQDRKKHLISSIEGLSVNELDATIKYLNKLKNH